jgi:hypothetical protein
VLELELFNIFKIWGAELLNPDTIFPRSLVEEVFTSVFPNSAPQNTRVLWSENKGSTRKFHYIIYNKKFCEELIAYFLWYDIGHIENGASNSSSVVACFFITVVTFLPSHCLARIGGILPSRCLDDRGILPSRCLAAIGGYTYRHTDTQTDGRDFLIRPLRWA